MIGTRNRVRKGFRNSTDRHVRSQLNLKMSRRLLECPRCKVLLKASITGAVRVEERAAGFDSQPGDGFEAAYTFGSHRCVHENFMATRRAILCEVFEHRSAHAGDASATPSPGVTKLLCLETLLRLRFLCGPSGPANGPVGSQFSRRGGSPALGLMSEARAEVG
jgi:hypothetical protein